MADCLDPACVNEPTCKASSPQLCGNNTMDVGEQCDDGNTTDGDGCDSNCLPTGCGNGVKTAGEACDDGNTTDGDGCDHNCTVTACGNGVQTGEETCDDGNLVDGDGCDSNCRPTGCGNGQKAGTEECDDGNTVNGDGCDNNCTVTACGNGVMTGTEACDDGNTANWDGCSNACTKSENVYVKASNTNASDSAGIAVAISGDGNTLVVGAEGESSNGTDQGDNSKKAAGAVYVYARTGTTWTQTAYLKASNVDAGDHFGAAVSVSADGKTIAIGAFGEASNSAADPANNAATGAGAVYVFGLGAGVWTQQAYLKAMMIAVNDQFGKAVALSGDGKTLASGSPGGEKVFLYARSGDTWAAQATVTATVGAADDNFGTAVALSTDGSTVAIGANHEDSAGTPDDNSKSNAGAAYVFARTGTDWAQQAYLKASDAAVNDDFGFAVTVSGDGATIAVGADLVAAPLETSGAAGGAVYVYSRTGSAWAQSAELKSTHARGNAFFGYSLSMSTDGKRLAIGAQGESSSATNVGGDESKIDAPLSGAAYLFVRTGNDWSQQSYVKATNTNIGDFFGRSISLSKDGSTLAVGAPFESGGATGINGNAADNSAAQSGAAYVYQ